MSKEEKLRAHVEKLLTEGGVMIHKDGKSVVVIGVKEQEVQTVDIVNGGFMDAPRVGHVVLKSLAPAASIESSGAG